jgi:hypothetical protein
MEVSGQVHTAGHFTSGEILRHRLTSIAVCLPESAARCDPVASSLYGMRNPSSHARDLTQVSLL